MNATLIRLPVAASPAPMLNTSPIRADLRVAGQAICGQIEESIFDGPAISRRAHARLQRSLTRVWTDSIALAQQADAWAAALRWVASDLAEPVQAVRP